MIPTVFDTILRERLILRKVKGMLSMLFVYGKLVDFKIDKCEKCVSDFNKSLVWAGFPFWEPNAFVVTASINDVEQGARIMAGYPRSEKSICPTPYQMIREIRDRKKQVNFCRKCGSRVFSYDSSYCSMCGKKL